MKEHGAKRRPQDLIDRARPRPGTPQGQFYDDMTIVKAEQKAQLKPGLNVVDMEGPVGRVYLPDGSIVENVTKVRV